MAARGEALWVTARGDVRCGRPRVVNEALWGAARGEALWEAADAERGVAQRL